MECYYCYILASTSTGRLYIGQTNNLQDRVRRHNTGLNVSTRNRGPWCLLYFKQFSSRSEAMLMERKLKSMKSPTKVKEWVISEGWNVPT